MMKQLKFFIVLLALAFSLGADAQINYQYFIVAARQDLSEEHYTDALQKLNTAIMTKPSNFEGYFLRGLAKYGLGDYNGAIMDFSRTLEIHPLYVRALQYRGISNDLLANYSDALADFEKALELDPFDADLYVAKGATNLHLTKYSEAIEDYDMALVIKPDFSLAYVNRGLAKSTLKQFDEALADLDKAVYYDIFNADVRFRRGIVQLQREAYADAMTDFNDALKLEPNNPLFYFNRAVAYLHLNDTLAAMKDYERVNELDERNALTYFNRGLLYSMKKDYSKALEMYDLVTLINPKNVYGYFNRSVVFFEMKQWANAEADLTSVLEIFPDFVGAWVNRSIVRERKGDEAGAYLDHQRAMQIIEMANGSGANTDSLYQLYADSTYFNKIMEFESDFVNGERKQKQVQFADVDIHPFGNMAVNTIDAWSYNRFEKPVRFYVDAFLGQLNATKQSNLRLVLMPENRQQNISMERLSDSMINSVEDADLRLFLEGLYETEIYNFQKAQDAFSQLIGKDPYDVYARLNLSSLLAIKADIMADNRPIETTALISTTKNPIKPDVQKTAPDYTPAVNLLVIKLSEQQEHPYLWYNLANLYLQMKEYNKAIDAYSMAIQFEPDFAEAYYNRALTLIFIGEPQLASKDLSKAGELGINEAFAVMKRFRE